MTITSIHPDTMSATTTQLRRDDQISALLEALSADRQLIQEVEHLGFLIDRAERGPEDRLEPQECLDADVRDQLELIRGLLTEVF